MADKRIQPIWDPIALAAQLRDIARQSQVLMRHFVSHQDAVRFGMPGRSTLGFDFFELMTRMMTDPVAVASAQIDLFYNTLGIWQRTAERVLMLRAREAGAPKDKRFKHPEWSENREGQLSRRGRGDTFDNPRRQRHGRGLCSQDQF